jgi:DNA-binding HxlR family transcriptional regulator
VRLLERDGFVERTVFPEVPPRVEYSITALGSDLLVQIAPVWEWIQAKMPEIRAARARFEQNAPATAAP